MPQRTLTEQEFNAIKAKALEAAPPDLKEDEFTRYIGPVMAAAIGTAENSPEPVKGSALDRFVSGAWKVLNPAALLDVAKHPIDTATALVTAQGAEFSKFNTAAKEGRDTEALGHLAAGLLPVVGPAAAHAGERIASGDVAGGMGEGAGLVGAVETPRALKVVRGGANTLATKVVTSPGLQGAIGATGGAVAGGSAGHPYIGIAIGSKYGAPIVKSVAEGVQSLTGGARPTVAAVLSDVELARQEFAAGRLSKAVLDAVERKAAASAPVVAQVPPQAAPAPASAPIAAPPSPPPPTAAAAPEAPPIAPSAPVSGDVARATSPQPQTPAQIANSVWKAARDAKVVLSPDENVAAFQAVKGGSSPADAIAAIKAPAAVAKATLTAPEAALVQKMRAAGKTDAEISTAIQNNRAFIAQFGTPTPTAAQTRFPKGARGGGVPEP